MTKPSYDVGDLVKLRPSGRYGYESLTFRFFKKWFDKQGPDRNLLVLGFAERDSGFVKLLDGTNVYVRPTSWWVKVHDNSDEV